MSTPKFREYARKNLVLVEIDFPKRTPQSDAIKQTNAAWQQRFKVESSPTLILLDSHFRALGRQDGYIEGGAKALIAELGQWEVGADSADQSAAGGAQ